MSADLNELVLAANVIPDNLVIDFDYNRLTDPDAELFLRSLLKLYDTRDGFLYRNHPEMEIRRAVCGCTRGPNSVVYCVKPDGHEERDHRGHAAEIVPDGLIGYKLTHVNFNITYTWRSDWSLQGTLFPTIHTYSSHINMANIKYDRDEIIGWKSDRNPYNRPNVYYLLANITEAAAKIEPDNQMDVSVFTHDKYILIHDIMMRSNKNLRQTYYCSFLTNLSNQISQEIFREMYAASPVFIDYRNAVAEFGHKVRNPVKLS